MFNNNSNNRSNNNNIRRRQRPHSAIGTRNRNNNTNHAASTLKEYVTLATYAIEHPDKIEHKKHKQRLLQR